MFEQASVTIRTIAFEEELNTFFLFVFVYERVFLNQISFPMSELTLVSIPARSSRHPVLAHLSFIQREVFFFIVLVIGILIRGIKWSILGRHLPHLHGMDILNLLHGLTPLRSIRVVDWDLAVEIGWIGRQLGGWSRLVGRNESVTI